MVYLIDTHALIWFLHNDKQLSKNALEVIENSDIVVSIASLWEVSIKTSLGKLTLAESFNDFFPKQLIINDIGILPIAVSHLHRVNSLNFFHRDPFDRLIIAQSLVEKMPLISKDTEFKAYGVDLVW